MKTIPQTLKCYSLVCMLFISLASKAQTCLGSLEFDPTNEYVNLPSSNLYYTDANGGYTWECWFKLLQPFGSAVRPLISSVDSIVFEDMYLGFGWQGGFFNEPVNKLIFKVDPPSGAPTLQSCGYIPVNGFVIGTWYHAAGVMDYANQMATLYVNGLPVDTKTISYGPNTRAIQTRLSYPTVPLDGLMDEVRIWTRPLNAQEILFNYDKCLAGNELNLFVYYRCNQANSSTVMDATANNNTGTFPMQALWSSSNAPVTGTNCVSSFNTFVSPTQICAGQQAIISAQSGMSYTWSTGSFSQSILVNPTLTTVYTVTASINNACVSTKTVEVKVINCIGIEEIQNTGFGIYPNPTNGTIHLSTSQPGKLAIYTIAGLLVSEKEFQQGATTLQLEALKAGMYFYRFISSYSTTSGILIAE